MQILRIESLLSLHDFGGDWKNKLKHVQPIKQDHYILLKIFTYAYSVISVQTEFLLKIHETWMAYSQFGIFMKTFWQICIYTSLRQGNLQILL